MSAASIDVKLNRAVVESELNNSIGFDVAISGLGSNDSHGYARNGAQSSIESFISNASIGVELDEAMEPELNNGIEFEAQIPNGNDYAHNDLNDLYEAGAHQSWRDYISPFIKINNIVKGVSVIHTTTDLIKVYKNASPSNILNASISSTQTASLFSGHVSYLPYLPAIKASVQVYNGDIKGAVSTVSFAAGFYIVGLYMPMVATAAGVSLLLISGAYGVYELAHLMLDDNVMQNVNNEPKKPSQEDVNDYWCPEDIPNGTITAKPSCGTFLVNEPIVTWDHF